MPNLDLEKHGKAIQLAISLVNMCLLLSGLLWAASQFYGDTKNMGAAQAASLRAIESKVETLSDQQQKSTNRIITMETQLRYVEQSVNRVDNTLSRIAPKL